MLDYIRDQPAAAENTLRVVGDRLGALGDLVRDRQPKRVIVAGLGSSYTAARIATPLLQRHMPLPTIVTVASELVLNRALPMDSETLVFLVSRSGERGWISDAQQAARRAGAACVAVTAVESSQLAMGADLVIATGEGPEAAYGKTKSVTACTVALMRIGLSFDGSAEAAARERALRGVPGLIETSVADAEEAVRSNLPWLSAHDHSLMAGVGGNEGVAQEGALKIQEAANVTSEWDNSGSVLHGALGVLGPKWLFVCLATREDYELDVPLLRLVGGFGAHRLSVAEPGLDLDADSEMVIGVPSVGDQLIAPLVYLPPLQLLTYYMATAQGLNPDKPAFAEVMLQAMLPPGGAEPDWAHAVEAVAGIETA
jgi:glucosamine--fructose-6-phosphate aminotransferase (isomerizing)